MTDRKLLNSAPTAIRSAESQQPSAETEQFREPVGEVESQKSGDRRMHLYQQRMVSEEHDRRGGAEGGALRDSRKPGSTRGFAKSIWNTKPAAAREAPPRSEMTIRGALSLRMICFSRGMFTDPSDVGLSAVPYRPAHRTPKAVTARSTAQQNEVPPVLFLSLIVFCVHPLFLCFMCHAVSAVMHGTG